MASIKGQCTLPWGTFNNSRNGMPNSVSSDDLVDCYEDLSYKNLEAQGELWLPLPAAEKETDKHKTMRRVILVLILCATIVGISWGVMQVMSSKNGSNSDATDSSMNVANVESDDSSSFMYEENHHGHEDSNSHRRDDHSSEDGTSNDNGASSGSSSGDSNSGSSTDQHNSDTDHSLDQNALFDHSHADMSDVDIWKEVIALEIFETFRHNDDPENGRHRDDPENGREISDEGDLESSIHTFIGLYMVQKNKPLESRLEEEAQSDTAADGFTEHTDSHTDHFSEGSDEMLSDLEEAFLVYEKLLKEQVKYEEEQQRQEEDEERQHREEEERQQMDQEEQQKGEQNAAWKQQKTQQMVNEAKSGGGNEESISPADREEDISSVWQDDSSGDI